MASWRQSSSTWRTMTWSGSWMGPGAVFSWQAASAGKTAAIRSSASIRWMGSGFFLPPRKRKMASERLRSQRQREVNMGDASTACSRVALYGVGVQQAGSRRQRETVLRAERQDDGVVVGGRLQLEVEGDAEPFAQSEAESPVDPPAERRMDDQLHAAGLVEEALEDDVAAGSA